MNGLDGLEFSKFRKNGGAGNEGVRDGGGMFHVEHISYGGEMCKKMEIVMVENK